MGLPWLTMLTCTERADYFVDTLNNLGPAGADTFPGKKKIYVDGSFVDHHHYATYARSGWEVNTISPKGLVGTKEALLYIMREAASADAEYLLYFEDDVQPCKNAVTFMERFEVPSHLGFITFCDIKHLGIKPGITEVPGWDTTKKNNYAGHWGNQALKVPLRSLKVMLEHKIPPDHGKYASDVVLGLMTAMPPKASGYGVFNPSVVQHTGIRSLVAPTMKWNPYGRLALSYPGSSFDALTLLTN